MLTLYGIANCDTVRRARAWLAARGTPYHFHDYKRAGVPAALDDWTGALGWEVVLNRAGQTFRKLPDEAKRNLDAVAAVALMRAHASAIKRPVLAGDGVLIAGFDPLRWEAALA